MLVNAVFREAYDHRQDRAGGNAHQPLQQQARDRVGVLMHFASRVDHGCGQRLQEMAAERAARGTGDGVPNHVL